MKRLLYLTTILLLGCGGTIDPSPPANARTVVTVSCNNGTVIYLYAEDCPSETCQGYGGVRQRHCTRL